MSTPTALAVIGGGHMGLAMVRGVIRAGLLDPQRVAVAEPDYSKHPLLALEGCRVERSAAAAIAAAGADSAVLLAVKPQIFPAVADELTGKVDKRLVVSIMAGVRSGTIAERLRGRVVRVMPNLGVAVGTGMSALAPGPGATPADTAWVRALLETMGLVEGIDESLMDAFTAVAGSGPAYLFYLAEGMARGAVDAGFDPAVAERIVRQTLRGAAELLGDDEGLSAAGWRARVTSKGGTTAAAAATLDAAGVMDAVARAVVAARDRGAELSRA